MILRRSNILLGDPSICNGLSLYALIIILFHFNLLAQFLLKLTNSVGFCLRHEGDVRAFQFADDGGGSSDEEDLSGGETPPRTGEEHELKDKLLRKYSGYISTLKHEFSKKKKKGKLPREARQTLFDWWNLHDKWPYPTVTPKQNTYTSMALINFKP